MVEESSESFSSFSIELVGSEESEDEIFSDILLDSSIIDVEDNQSNYNDQLVEITSRMTISFTISPVWKFFARKEKTVENQSGEEQIVQYIYCNVGGCHLSESNSTTTLECHLKAKHKDAYVRLHDEQVENIEPWTSEEQKKIHVFLLNWIVIDQQPFTLVENHSFQNFILKI